MSKMEKGLELLMNIKENPQKIIGKKSLMCLRCFLAGCAYFSYENNIHDSNCWHGFQKYIETKYNSRTPHGWAELIYFYSDSDEEAFDNFFNIFEEFLLLPQETFNNSFNEEKRPSNYELLKRIYKRPGLYIGSSKSFQNLLEFINGYIYYCKTYNIVETFHFDAFEKYLQEKFKVDNRPWYKFIIFYSIGDDNAFECFYYEYAEFLKIKYNIDFSYKE